MSKQQQYLRLLDEDNSNQWHYVSATTSELGHNAEFQTACNQIVTRETRYEFENQSPDDMLEQSGVRICPDCASQNHAS